MWRSLQPGGNSCDASLLKSSVPQPFSDQQNGNPSIRIPVSTNIREIYAEYSPSRKEQRDFARAGGIYTPPKS